MKIRNRGWFVIAALLVLFLASSAVWAGELLEKVWDNDVEAVKSLLSAGADVNEADPQSGNTPLIFACRYNYLDMARLLIDKGADVNRKAKDGSTALMMAAYASPDMVKLLIGHGADVKARNNIGTGAFTNAVIAAMESEGTETAELLLEAGADVDEAATAGPTAGYTPLMMAARNNRPGLVSFLIAKGADVNARAKDGKTPLALAQQEGHTDVVNLLKAGGATE